MFNTVEEAIEDIKLGKMVVVVDDENRENEGDLIMAAEMVTPAAINFMAIYGRGLICMPLEEELANKLNFHSMVENNTDNHETAFTVSIDHIKTTTGISAAERSLTIRKTLEEGSVAEDFRRPGHLFPLVAKPGGVIKRVGHTEAAVDLAKLAGLKPAGVIVEIMNDDGTMARRDDLYEFSKKHNLKFITIEALRDYRLSHSVELATIIDLPTVHGDFKMYGFVDHQTDEHHVALVKGRVAGKENVLSRVHSECLTGDVLASKRCDCGEQLDTAIKRINDKGEGILIYMRQEGRGIGLINKMKAYALQDQGFDTVEANLMLGFDADEREYNVTSQIYKLLGVNSINLMTNNPRKINGIESNGVTVSKRIEIQMNHNERNEFYLKTKKEKLDHMLVY